MQSRLLKKLGATAPVLNEPSGQMSYEEALANLSGGRSYEEVVADLFCTEEEEDAAIQAILRDDPEGEKGIPWEQARAEGNRLLAELEAAALRRLAAKGNLSKYGR